MAETTKRASGARSQRRRRRPVVLYLLAGLAAAAVAFGLFWWSVSAFVERPKHSVAMREGAFELRDYPALLAAEVATEGGRGDAVRAGFRPLAGYIFARERDGPAIAMTAPVTQSPAEAGGWRVGFIMPSAYDRESLPAPAATEIELVEIPARRMAAIRFSGAWTDARFAEKTQALTGWMRAHGLRAAGPPVFAYYNDPFTPSFLRRNEVLIEVAP